MTRTRGRRRGREGGEEGEGGRERERTREGGREERERKRERERERESARARARERENNEKEREVQSGVPHSLPRLSGAAPSAPAQPSCLRLPLGRTQRRRRRRQPCMDRHRVSPRGRVSTSICVRTSGRAARSITTDPICHRRRRGRRECPRPDGPRRTARWRGGSHDRDRGHRLPLSGATLMTCWEFLNNHQNLG